MALRIESLTFNDVLDKRLLLYNAQVARRLVFGNDWTRLRIAMRFAFGDYGASLQQSLFYFGLMSNPTSPTLTNGPLNTNTSHFMGQTSNATTLSSWGRAVTSGLAYYGSVNQALAKKINTTVTRSPNVPLGYLSAAPGPTPCRLVLMMEFKRNSSIEMRIQNLYPSPSTPATVMKDLPTKEALIGGMEIEGEDLLSVENWLEASVTGGGGNYTRTTSGNTLAYDETADGPLNAVVVAWNRSIVPMVVSEILYAKMA